MAGVSKIKELEARKRALVTESEICRETLKAELQNLQLYADGLRKRVDRVRGVGPWLLFALPLLKPLVGLFSRKQNQNHVPRPSRLKSGLATMVLALRLYRKYSPIVRTLASRLVSRRRRSAEDRKPAANI